MNLDECNIGIIGLGQMGSGIAHNLIRAGYSITVYDIKPEAISKLMNNGVKAAESSKDIVTQCDVILTCVEGSDSICLADNVLLPEARSGQIFIDHSTVPAPETRRIGTAFIEKGSNYLDAPISGGKSGADKGMLRIFVGGDKGLFDMCLPIFSTIGDEKKVVYCGAIGMGQVAKVVQQLTSRFPDVARLEVMVFGLRGGLQLETLMRALDVKADSDDPYARLYRAILKEDIGALSFEFAEWKYYLDEAEADGFCMPMLKAMYEFCKDAEKTTFDALMRPEPSIWNNLINAKPK